VDPSQPAPTDKRDWEMAQPAAPESKRFGSTRLLGRAERLLAPTCASLWRGDNCRMTVALLALVATSVLLISAAVHHWLAPVAIAVLVALGTVGFVAFGQTSDDAGVVGLAFINDVLVGIPLILVSSAGVGLGKGLATRSSQRSDSPAP